MELSPNVENKNQMVIVKKSPWPCRNILVILDTTTENHSLILYLLWD